MEFNVKQVSKTPRASVAAEPLGSTLTVRAKLALLGWRSLDAWARAHGYEESMPGYVVRTWGNRTDKKPHGGISRSVMRDLRRTFSRGIGPDQVQEIEATNA